MLTVEQQRARSADARREAQNATVRQLAARAARVRRAAEYAHLVAAAEAFMAAEMAHERTELRASRVRDGKLRRADTEAEGWRSRDDAKIQRCQRCYVPHNGAHRCTRTSRLAALEEMENVA